MNDVIREVEWDEREGVVVAVEDAIDAIQIPVPCAGCLAEATKLLPSRGAGWPQFPYCDACAPPLSDDHAKRQRESRGIWRWFGLMGRLLVQDVLGPRGDAVKCLLSETGTIRLGFRNAEYARLFVEANGAELPPAPLTDDAVQELPPDATVWDQQDLSH